MGCNIVAKGRKSQGTLLLNILVQQSLTEMAYFDSEGIFRVAINRIDLSSLDWNKPAPHNRSAIVFTMGATQSTDRPILHTTGKERLKGIQRIDNVTQASLLSVYSCSIRSATYWWSEVASPRKASDRLFLRQCKRRCGRLHKISPCLPPASLQTWSGRRA